jgi:hypothetical protein
VVWDLNLGALAGQGLLIPYGDRVIIQSFDGDVTLVKVTEPTLPVTRVVDDGSGGIVYRVDADLFHLREGSESPELILDPPRGEIPTPISVWKGGLLVLLNRPGVGAWEVRRIDLDTGLVDTLFRHDAVLDTVAISEDFVVIRRTQPPPPGCSFVIDEYLDECLAAKGFTHACNWFEIYALKDSEGPMTLGGTSPNECPQGGDIYLGEPQMSESTLYWVEQVGSGAGSPMHLSALDLSNQSRNEIAFGQGMERGANSVMGHPLLTDSTGTILTAAPPGMGEPATEGWLVGRLDGGALRVFATLDSLAPDQGVTGPPTLFARPGPHASEVAAP